LPGICSDFEIRLCLHCQRGQSGSFLLGVGVQVTGISVSALELEPQLYICDMTASQGVMRKCGTAPIPMKTLLGREKRIPHDDVNVRFTRRKHGNREQKVVTNFLQDLFPPLCIIWIQEIVRWQSSGNPGTLFLHTLNTHHHRFDVQKRFMGQCQTNLTEQFFATLACGTCSEHVQDKNRLP